MVIIPWYLRLSTGEHIKKQSVFSTAHIQLRALAHPTIQKKSATPVNVPKVTKDTCELPAKVDTLKWAESARFVYQQKLTFC